MDAISDSVVQLLRYWEYFGTGSTSVRKRKREGLPCSRSAGMRKGAHFNIELVRYNSSPLYYIKLLLIDVICSFVISCCTLPYGLPPFIFVYSTELAMHLWCDFAIANYFKETALVYEKYAITIVMVLMKEI